MNGAADDNNPSGINFDSSKVQTFVFDFDDQTIRFGVLIGGSICYVHEIDSSNSSTIPWASSASHPLRYEMISTVSSPASVMRVMSSSVTLEGEHDVLGRTKTIYTANHVDASTAGTTYAMLGLRLNSLFPRGDLNLDDFTILAETADDFLWELIVGGNVAGTFTYSDVPASAFQYAQGATANTITGGIAIKSGLASSNAPVIAALKTSGGPGLSIDGTPTELILAVTPLGANADIRATLDFTELS